MKRLGHSTLVGYSSVVELQGEKKPRMVRPRTAVYAALLAGLAVTGGTLVASRVPFEVSVNRAPGSLFTLDADGSVRNTYLLKVTSNDPRPEPVRYEVAVEGLEGAEVLYPMLMLRSEESRTVPLVIRVPRGAAVARSVPIRVTVRSPSEAVVVAATFMTGTSSGAARSIE
jgi:hypothetical protein